MSYQKDRIIGIPSPLPADYDRQANFTDYAGEPPRGPDLDAEFNAVEQALDETQARLRLIQRDDGAVANNSIGLDQLKNEARIGVNTPSEWEPFTQFQVNDSVIDPDGAWYVAQVSHVSSDDFEADLAQGRWRQLIDLVPHTKEARNWATFPVDQLVPEGNLSDEYSAFHHRTYAEAAQGGAETAQGLAEQARDTAIGARDTTLDAQTQLNDRFDRFFANGLYSFLGDYESGITVSEYNEIIRDSDGEFWRLSGDTALPYTTDGSGLPEGGAFTPLGDAVLRQELDSDGGVNRVRGALATVDSLADAKGADWLSVGMMLRTLGYHEPGDGGGATYTIVPPGTGTDDGGSYIDLPGSGLQARNSFLLGFVNVKQFGVKADEESTEAFNNAVSMGGSVVIPSGDYISGKIRVRSGTSISGAGIYATSLMLADNSHVGISDNQNILIQCGDFEESEGETLEKISVSDMTLNGNSANNQGFGAASLFHAYRTGGINLENLYLVDSHNRGIDIYNKGNVHAPRNNLRINNVLIEGSQGEGAYIRHAVRHVSVSNLQIYDCAKRSGPNNISRESGTSAALIIDHSEGSYSNIRVNACHGHGLWVRNTTGINMTNINTTGNAGHGMFLDRFVSATGASWISHGNGQAQANEYSDIYFTDVDDSYGRTKDLSVSGITVGNGRVYFVEQEDKEAQTRWGIEFADPDGDAIYENVTLSGVSYASNEYYGSGPGNLWGNVKLPKNRDTLYIGDESRSSILAHRHAIQRWGFEDRRYEVWENPDGIVSLGLLDSIMFSRDGEATYFGPAERMTAAADEPRLEYDREARRRFRGFLQEKRSVNLIHNSEEPSGSQDIAVDAEEYTLSFEGPSAASITLSGAHAATLSGAGDNRLATYTFTPDAGTLTVTYDGDVKNAQLEEGGAATSRIITASSPKARPFDYCEATLGQGLSKFFGAVLLDFTLHEINVNRGLLDFDNGIRLQASKVGLGGLSYVFVAGDSTLLSVPVRFGINTRTRIAFSWRRDGQGNNVIDVAINGRLHRRGEVTTGSVMQTEAGDRVGIFNRLDASNGESGWIHDLRVFPFSPTIYELTAMSRID